MFCTRIYTQIRGCDLFRRIFVAAAVSFFVLTFDDLKNPQLHAQEAGARQTTEKIAPWPQNRLRSYYANRARGWLKQQTPLPDILPPYPGLDGGTFGHWGQYPSQRSLDASMSEVEFGGLMSTVTGHFRKMTTKALIVQPGDSGDMTALFDPTELSFMDVWEGPLATFSPAMLGLITPATPRGDQLINLQASKWNAPDNTERQYIGLYRHGRNVVFRYQIGDADILDRSWKIDEHFARSLQVDGSLRNDCSLTLLDVGAEEIKKSVSRTQSITIGAGDNMLTIALRGDGAQLVVVREKVLLNFTDVAETNPIHIAFIRGDAKVAIEAFAGANIPRPDSLTRGGVSQWGDRTVTTNGEVDINDGAFAIDTLTIPAADLNEFNVPFRVSGFELLPDNRCVVSTLYGDIWIVNGIDDDLSQLTWKRVACGLHQPLGVLYQNEKLLVTGRDQITHLHDLNGDSEYDFYECLTNDYSTAPGHEVVTNLRQDQEQNLYFSNAVDGITKYDYQNHALEVLGSGIRYCNGIEVSPDG